MTVIVAQYKKERAHIADLYATFYPWIKYTWNMLAGNIYLSLAAFHILAWIKYTWNSK